MIGPRSLIIKLPFIVHLVQDIPSYSKRLSAGLHYRSNLKRSSWPQVDVFANNFLCIARCGPRNPVDDIPWTYSKSWPVTGFILSGRLCAPSFQQILEVFSFLLPGSGGEFTFRDWSCQKGSSSLLTSLSVRADKFLQDYPVVLRKIVRNARKRPVESRI